MTLILTTNRYRSKSQSPAPFNSPPSYLANNLPDPRVGKLKGEHYYWVNTPRYITQNYLSNNISTKMYFKSETKQYLLWCFNIVLWLITWCLRESHAWRLAWEWDLTSRDNSVPKKWQRGILFLTRNYQTIAKN